LVKALQRVFVDVAESLLDVSEQGDKVVDVRNISF
jgi:hypothetical protein